MQKRLAFMTIGVAYEPMGQPRVQGFVDRIPAVYGAADSSEGFVARSVRDMTSFDHSWGNIEIPECYLAITGDPLRLPSTLSLWEDLESVAAYAYHGAHGEALSKRKEWFERHDVPVYVAWWVDADTEKLDRIEAAQRLDHLKTHGPSPYAFNFAKPFDAEGKPCTLDQAKVRAKIAANASVIA